MNNDLEIPEEICKEFPNSKILHAFKSWIENNSKNSYFLATPKSTFFDRFFYKSSIYPNGVISRIGGFPPVLEADLIELLDDNWQFLLQLNLEEIPFSPLLKGFDKAGILSVFLNRDREEGPIKLKFYRKDSFHLLYQARHQLNKAPKKVLPINIVMLKSLPEQNSFGLDIPELSELDDSIKELIFEEILVWHESYYKSLGVNIDGHFFFPEISGRAYQIMQENYKGMNYIPLLKIGADSNDGLSLGSNVIYVFIDKEDLLNQHFHKSISFYCNY